MSDLTEILDLVKAEKISLQEGVRRIKHGRSQPGNVVPLVFRLEQEEVEAIRPGDGIFQDSMLALFTSREAWETFMGSPAIRRRLPKLRAVLQEATPSKRQDDRLEWNFLSSGGMRSLIERVGPHASIIVVDTARSAATIEGGDGVDAAAALFHLFREIAALAAHTESRCTFVGFLAIRYGEARPPYQAAVDGAFRSLAQEMPSVRFSQLHWQVRDERDLGDDLLLAFGQLGDSAESSMELRDGRLFRSVLRHAADGRGNAPLALGKGETFLITGGMGRIGLAVAGWLARHGANLVLFGRSDLSESAQEQAHEIERLGVRVLYRKVDIADYPALESTCRDVVEGVGRIDGVFHCAGVNQDSLAVTKTREQAEIVMAPKIAGTVNLDRVLRDQPLQFFACFSSTSSVFGNLGQSDYAFANRFMDAWMERREGPGKSLSICWPFWENGGMQVQPEVLARWRRDYGLVPMPTRTGIEVLESLLSQADGGRRAVFYGESRALDSLLRRGSAASSVVADHERRGGVSSQVDAADRNAQRTRVVDMLVQLLAREIKTSAERIDTKQVFGDYGLDSTMIIHMTLELEKTFGTLSKTLFYEYPNIGALADYLLREHGQALQAGFIHDHAIVKTRDKRGDAASERPWHKLVRTTTVPKRRIERSDIAVIGLAGRYPKARDLSEFWRNLRSGTDCITEIPSSRWEWQSAFDPAVGKAGSIYCKWGGFLDDVDQFDARFFNVTPNDARCMDPQQRLFLEVVHELLEDAGYTRESVASSQERRIGVFVGVMWAEYALVGLDAARQGKFRTARSQYWEIPNRVSYFFDFRGPSLCVDSACSSSLTAIHYAVESLRSGESEVCIAGGVNLSLHLSKYQGLCEGRFASTHGRCKSFGEGGDGYVPGEGVGAALLKPLEMAINDGDNIYGVICGTGVNHGGRQNGFTVPSPSAQTRLIVDTMTRARVSPEEVGYIEAHGTGTQLGDPIEIRGLVESFSRQGGRKGVCAIGSVKSNIGHLEAASGIAGLTKVLLQIRNKELAPSLHCEVENKNLQLEETPFLVQKQAGPWMPANPGAKYRTAAISSFGAGGSNAHIVVQEWESPPSTCATSEDEELFVFSAKQIASLRAYCAKFAQFLSTTEGRQTDIRDIAYTLAVGREGHQRRICLFADSTESLQRQLKAFFIEEMTAERVQSLRQELVQRAQTPRLHRRLGLDLQTLAVEWLAGGSVDWAAVFRKERGERRRISLPTYCFQRNSYWIT